ncbi:MAG: glycosyltransferase family 39 protein [Chloroflexi bacterium]|nr:glycosyltransferase family 39 protein [Chloroflexota bacterium]
MTISATLARPVSLPTLLPGLQVVVGLAIFVALAIPLLMAEPAALTSDESLYVSEGLNLAEGNGFTYSTGEAVIHRGPVFPALLAVDFTIGGFSIEHAYVVPKLFALGSALLLLALGWRFFGREAGLLAGVLALASSLLTTTGSSLSLDGTQSFFLLLALLLLHPALKEGRPLYAGLAGGALGLAMLTKESALLWLPLPFLAVLLLGPAVRNPGRLLTAYGAGFIAVAGWWWPYVYAMTGEVYLVGSSWTAMAWLAAGVIAVPLVATVTVLLTRRASPIKLSQNGRWALTSALLLAWGSLLVIGMEQLSTWDVSPHYFTNVPEYTKTVLASWVQPLPLIAVAWGYVAYRAYKGSLGDRLLTLGLLLFLPFALFVANGSLHVSNMLPLVYLSYAALARSAVDFARWLARRTSEGFAPAVGAAAAAVLLVGAFGWFAFEESQRVVQRQDAFDATLVQQGNWNNPLALETAGWIEEHIPAGTPIMSGRLYSTHLYSLTGAQYPMWQLPTVRVDIGNGTPGLTRAGTLFRWEDHSMPSGQAEPWLYLRRHPVNGYYVALSEQDLMAGLREHEIEYLVLTGDDAGFSSLSLLPYFETHPYFKNVTSFVADETNQTHIFQVVGTFDEPTAAPALVNDATVAALEEKLGAERAQALLRGLSPGGYATSSAYAAVRPPQAAAQTPAE